MTFNRLNELLVQPPLAVAILVALAIAGLALAGRWLTRDGAVATAVVGTIVFGLGGGKFIVPLLAFFITSSLLSRLGRRRKAANAHGVKGATRDAGQVIANGGIAALLVLIFRFLAYSQLVPLDGLRAVLILDLAALATVNADTWATEIGGLSRAKPRLLANWRPVEPGVSGAVTGLGLVGALVGSVVIPLTAMPLWKLDPAEFLVVVWAGFLGNLIDSLLGAGAQAVYRDPATGDLTEQSKTDGHLNAVVRGIPWMNNDVVNFLASGGGALCAWALLHYSVFPFR